MYEILKCVWDAWVAWRIVCKSFLSFWVLVGHLYCTAIDEISDANKFEKEERFDHHHDPSDQPSDRS